MTSRSVLLIATLAAAVFACKPAPAIQARAIEVVGAVSLERAGETLPLKTGDTIASGDVIRTGADGVVVLEFNDQRAQAEIQPDGVFRVEVSENKTDLHLDRGNVWLNVRRRDANEEFYLRTPTTIAAVRGTRFYTAQIGDVIGVCHCEGAVEVSSGADYKAVHAQDTLAFTRNGRTVTLTLADLPAGIPYQHDHSALNDSPLGKRNALTPEMIQKVIEVADRKFAELD
jgi:hypothetical protein